MSKISTLPSTAPFAPEQIAALDQVIGSASVAQRAWLSGFLAGLDAAELRQTAPAAAATGEKPKLLIVYATESGNSEALAAKAKADAQKRGFSAKVLDLGDATPEALKAAGNVIAIISTWGDGEPPQRAAPFYRALMSDSAPRLEGVRFAVLALGDSSYAQFCETGRQFDARLAALGATRAAEHIELDLDYEAGAKTWLGTTLDVLAPKDAGSVIHVDFVAKPAPATASKTAPYLAEITAHHKLTSERAANEILHVELSLEGSGLTYEPGDALAVLPENDPALVHAVQAAIGGGDAALSQALATQYDICTLTAKQVHNYAALTGDKALGALAEDVARVKAFLAGRQWIDLLETFPHKIGPAAFTALLRPLAPRSYSIASSQKLVGAQADLTIARLAYESAGRPRLGVASSLVADRRKSGDTLPVFVKPNPHFRLPASAKTPIIMVGAGTGLAPYRGFLQELEATGAGNESWLVFGHRNFLYDFLYQLEIQAWLKSGVLGRLDLASSRDQPEKRYVQHVLWEQRERLQAKLADGAVLYLCGDAKHMAHDVEAVLQKILGGQAALDGLISAGRYKKDVY